MVFSVIDIGTNTILMVTLRVEEGRMTVLGDEHEIARLGQGVDAMRTILPETFDRVAGYLLRYRAIAEELGAEKIVAFGTSALRDARNREEFIGAMRERCGIAIEIVSGEEEAKLTYRGALFGLPIEGERCSVLDIGGGSTEIASGTVTTLDRAISLDIGAVRITERFFPSSPPTPDELEGAREYARTMLSRAFDLPPDGVVIGVAGTVTTLGAMAAGMEDFNADALNGTRLTREEIARITWQLSTMPLDDIKAIPQVHPARADILLGGAIILDEFMTRYNLPGIIVSTRGVRYGVGMRVIDD